MTMLRPVVVPGRVVSAAETAVLPVRREPGPSGLHRARMTDLRGVDLYVGWVPAGARLVRRGERVFVHRQGDEWRQVDVVTLGEDGRPL